MIKKKELFLKTIDIFTIVLLYYIVGDKSLYLYVLSFSLYKIFSSAFNHISILKLLNSYSNNDYKRKILNYMSLIIGIISLFFLLLGIVISDITGILLNISDSLIVFIFMGLSISAKPLFKIIIEYLSSIHNKNYDYLKDIINFSNNILIIIMALLSYRIFNLNEEIAVSLLYIPKIILVLLGTGIVYLINVKPKGSNLNRINYFKEIKPILVNDSYQSIIEIVKNSYFYISIVILYLILNTRYNYDIDVIKNDIVFIYFYAIALLNYIIYLIKNINYITKKDLSITNKIYYNFKIMLTINIIFDIISPLLCKIIFNNSDMAIYLVMVNFMGIFIALYDLIYQEVKNRKIIYISLFIGILVKIVTVIPLINAFYRMGYNLIYGDIISTSIGILLSIIVGGVYLNNVPPKKDNKFFEKTLDILFDNILLAIILIGLEFVVPINTSNYFHSIGIIIVYLVVSFVYLSIKSKK